MKAFWYAAASLIVVALSFEGACAIHPQGWRALAILGAMTVLQLLYVQKHPKQEAMKWALKVPRGQTYTVEVEGK